MDSKLIITLDKIVIKRAKEYAFLHKRSLSKIIEAYLKSLIVESQKREDDIKLSPFVKSMFTGTKISADLNYKDEFIKHMDE